MTNLKTEQFEVKLHWYEDDVTEHWLEETADTLEEAESLVLAYASEADIRERCNPSDYDFGPVGDSVRFVFCDNSKGQTQFAGTIDKINVPALV